MPEYSLTKEQRRVVEHPLGSHAKVLAVAGSGKSTTLVERVAYLVEELGIKRSRIQVFMFNKEAEKSFKSKLQARLQTDKIPPVHTFHAFAFRYLSKCEPAPVFWTGEQEMQARAALQRAMEKVLKDPKSIDLDTVREYIGHEKNGVNLFDESGNPPFPEYPDIFREYERIRLAANAFAFDDFVPFLVDQLRMGEPRAQMECKVAEVILVDEYQDINGGQQELVERLAAGRADVMVVGDDDQTIYEWRGARPELILKEFERRFEYKPIREYTLSESFRFGKRIAQCAAKAIERNTNRKEKKLRSAQPRKKSVVELVLPTDDESGNSNRALMEKLAALVPSRFELDEVLILGRTYAQMSGMEIELLTRGIPYNIDNRKPLFQRSEIQQLFDVFRLARLLDMPLNDVIARKIKNLVPALQMDVSADDFHGLLMNRPDSRLEKVLVEVANRSHASSQNLASLGRRLLDILHRVHERMQESRTPAGELLKWVMAEIQYTDYLYRYYSRADKADETLAVLHTVIAYSNTCGENIVQFMKRVGSLQTHNEPGQPAIQLKTIHGAKGLEAELVVVPDCREGYMPYWHQQKNIDMETERRLFYVAVTRARQMLLVGSSEEPAKKKMRVESGISRFLREAGIV